MSKFTFNENMYGRKVKFICDGAHMDMPEYYPVVGTVGTVVEFYNNYKQRKDWKVQWPKGSTSRDDCWFCDEEDVELIEEVDKQMTNEEIWEMLKNKMEKNFLKSVVSIIHTSTDKDCSKFDLTHVYAEDNVHNAIALAYKVGYERAMKGRPFKIGEKNIAKKKSGHWEPVDPNNLPKEGTKVRYAREIDDICSNFFSDWTGMKIGEESIVMYNNEGYFGVKSIHGGFSWYSSYKHPDRFDMWVEDDE